MSSTLSWSSAADWDANQSEDKVVHESVANTDHDDASIIKQGYSYANSYQNPIAYYPLDEDSGSTANDVAGSNDGTVNGATQGATGILGTSCYSFNGSDDDYIELPNLGLGGSDFTLSLWYNVQSTGNRCLFGRYNGTDVLQIYIHPTDGHHEVRLGHVGGNEINHDFGTPQTDVWTNVGIVYDSSEGAVDTYINGSHISNSSSTVDDFTETDGPWIGRRTDGHGAIDADIDDVRIYDFALSSSQIQFLYDVATTNASFTSSTKVA